MADHLDKSLNDNGIHRRDFLKRVTMAGTGLALSVTGGTAKYRIATTPLINGQGYPLVPWLSMRGNRQNTGISPLVGFNFTSNGRTPALYRGDTNKPDSKVLSLINATPIIGVTDGNEVVYVGSSDNHFYAFTVTGTGTLTSIPLKNIVDSAGCFISKDQLYFPTGDFSLYATGTTPPLSNTVEYPMDKTKDPSPSTIDWFEGNVVADVNNLLYAGCDNFYLHCCQPGAENPPLWRFATGFFIWSACAFSPDNSSAYFAGADMTLYALGLNGAQPPELKWSFPAGNVCTSSPAVDSQNVIYFGAFDGTIYAIDGGTGDPVWTYPTKSLIYASPAIYETADGVLLYLISSDGVMRALQIKRGTKTPSLLWEFFTGMPSFSSAALGPDPENPGGNNYLIYVGTGNGEVLALQPDGARRWSFDISTFYQPDPAHPVDPAFLLSLKYPAINSSVAIGINGLGTATSGGLILFIDYLYYTTKAKGINLSSVDDYIDQLPDGGHYCYISPAGRMAETVLASSGSTLTLYPAEVITFTLLEKKTYGTDQTRSSFAQIPDKLDIRSGDLTLNWRASADLTQLYIYPISELTNSRTITIRDATTQQELLDFAVTYQSATNPMSPADLLQQRLQIQQMSIYAPFVVPALDQLGIATITIPFRVVELLNPDKGTVWAYGYESYGASGAGVPTRNLLYVFTGTYQKGNLLLDSMPSYFELTGFPSPIDTLKVTGIVNGSAKASETNFIGLSLFAEYTLTIEGLLKWLCTYITHWVGIPKSILELLGVSDLCDLLGQSNNQRRQVQSDFSSICETLGIPEVYCRIFTFLSRLAGGFETIVDDWKLFSKERFTWAGTCTLGTNDLSPQPPNSVSFKHDAKHQPPELVATLEFSTNPDGYVFGIVLLGGDGTPVELNYTDRNSTSIQQTGSLWTVKQTLDLTNVAVTGCTAILFLNLVKLKEFKF